MQVPQQVCQGNLVAPWDIGLRRRMSSSSWKYNCSRSYHLGKLESMSLWHTDFWPEHSQLFLLGISGCLQVPLSHCYNICLLPLPPVGRGWPESWCGAWMCDRLTQVQKWWDGAHSQLSSSLSQMDWYTCLDDCSSCHPETAASGCSSLSIWCYVFGSPKHVTPIRVRKC